MWKGAGGELTALVSFLPFNCAALPVTAPLNWRGHTLPGPSQWDGLGEMKFIYLFIHPSLGRSPHWGPQRRGSIQRQDSSGQCSQESHPAVNPPGAPTSRRSRRAAASDPSAAPAVLFLPDAGLRRRRCGPRHLLSGPTAVLGRVPRAGGPAGSPAASAPLGRRVLPLLRARGGP
jgi:hypothetical protein